VRVQVLDQLRAGEAQRDGPGFGVAVGVAGVGQDVAEGDAGKQESRGQAVVHARFPVVMGLGPASGLNPHSHALP
jgi:hypothetical protein